MPVVYGELLVVGRFWHEYLNISIIEYWKCRYIFSTRKCIGLLYEENVKVYIDEYVNVDVDFNVNKPRIVDNEIKSL